MRGVAVRLSPVAAARLLQGGVLPLMLLARVCGMAYSRGDNCIVQGSLRMRQRRAGRLRGDAVPSRPLNLMRVIPTKGAQ